MLRTLAYRLYPTPSQISRLFHYLQVGRKLYNDGLEQRIKYYKDTGKSLSYMDQCKDLAQLRNISQVLKDVPSIIERDALNRLDKAFRSFFRRCKNKDEKAGFPRFKSANRWNSFSIGINKGCNPIRLDRRIYISGVDRLVKVRNFRESNGKIKISRIVHKAGKWYAHLVVDDMQQPPPKVEVKVKVGIDVGLTSFATLSNGTKIPNPKFGKKLSGKLRRAHQRLSRCEKGSANRRKAILNLQKVYEKISNQRYNFTHHLSKELISKYQLIAIEKLQIKNMVRNRKYSKGIMDAAWSQLFRYLEYKAENAGTTVIAVDPRGTSQMCSWCKNIVLKDITVRIHDCPKCGIRLDRDHNAARNILQRANSPGRGQINASGVANGRR